MIDQGSSSVADDNYLDLQPASGVEWVVHNIKWSDDIEIYSYDGTNAIKIFAATDFGFLPCEFHCSNTKYYRVKNVSGGSQYISFDGVISKNAS